MTAVMPELLTVAQVATTLQVHQRKVRQLVQAGEIAAINVGGEKNGVRLRIDPAELDRWMQTRRYAA